MLVFPPGSFHLDVSPGTNLVNVFAPKDVPRHAISFGSLGQGTFESRRTLLAGTHRIAVVLDYSHDRNRAEYRKIEPSFKPPLTKNPIPHPTKPPTPKVLHLPRV